MPLLLDNPEVATKAIPCALNVPRGMPRQIGTRERFGLALASFFSLLFGPRGKSAFGILMYHRVVDPPPGFPRPTWNVPPAKFEEQLGGLLELGWQALALRQVIECIKRDLPI